MNFLAHSTERTRIDDIFAYTTKNNHLHADHIHLALIGEEDHSKAIYFLKEKSQKVDTYVGFGGMLNLSYILITQPKVIRLCDINPLQKFFWDRVFDAIRHIENIEDFKNFLIKSEKELPHLLRKKFAHHPFSKALSLSCYFDSIHQDSLPWESPKGPYRSMDNVSEWLSQNNKADLFWLHDYQKLRQIIMNADYKADVIDIYDPNVIANLKNDIKKSYPRSIGIYVSSIPRFSDWAGRDMMIAFKKRFDTNLTTIEETAPLSITIDDRTLTQKTHDQTPQENKFSFERKAHVI